MSFTERDKLKALAIVHIFETGKPLGDYSAVAVLNDGAGISYGINQFTHRSGSLAKVVRRWRVAVGSDEADDYWKAALKRLEVKTPTTVASLSTNSELKQALKHAGKEPEMQQAQREIAEEMYLRPAIKACEGSGFVLPLSLAVIYDSINHGSYEKIRDRVVIRRTENMPDLVFERLWVSSYVRNRDAWLESIPRLAPTDYRTDFFLGQINRNNWQLNLPVNVNGFRLTEQHLNIPAPEPPAVIPPIADQPNGHGPADTPSVSSDTAPKPDERSWGERSLEALEAAGKYVEEFGRPIDRAAEIGDSIRRRSDSVKSMWATVGSTAWQALWAVAAFFIGLPIEVWLLVAVIAAAFGLFYLYRQISLGKIREGKHLK